MFTPRLARAAALAVPRSMRAFGSTAVPQRAPSISDITPDQVGKFNEKQKAFREHLAAQQKMKEESECARPRVSPAPCRAVPSCPG